MVHLDLVLSRCCTSNLTMSDKSHERESRIGQGVLKEMGPGGGGWARAGKKAAFSTICMIVL
jgi:hypothetical protein